MANQSKSKVDHTARLNDQFRVALQEIVDAVEGGDNDGFELPFQAGGRPYNPATGHAATGTNALICLLLGVNYYSTYDGWQKLGYQVPRGQNARANGDRHGAGSRAVRSSTGDAAPRQGPGIGRAHV